MATPFSIVVALDNKSMMKVKGGGFNPDKCFALVDHAHHDAAPLTLMRSGTRFEVVIMGELMDVKALAERWPTVRVHHFTKVKSNQAYRVHVYELPVDNAAAFFDLSLELGPPP